MRKRLALLIGFTLAGCSAGTIGPQAENTSDIIGGTVDTGDPSVVIVFAQQPGSPQGSLCTASVIAPTVLLTAAHCVSPDEVGQNVTFRAFLGSDFHGGTGQWVPVAKVDWDHAFDPNNLSGGHDVGIVVLQNPVSLKPLPYNNSAAITGLAGSGVRLVGYGNNDGAAATGAGIKRQVLTRLDGVSDKLLHIGDDAHETCQGDSGGPALMMINGVETIVGVTSYGFSGCTGGGYDTRVDLYTSLIDAYVGASGAGATCTPHCGGRTCGDDGCGGTCGACGADQSCSAAGVCVGSAQPPASGCDWETEPNDSPGAANALCPDGHIYGSIAESGDVDWYGFRIGAGQNYYVDLSTLPADFGFTVYKVVNGFLYTIGTGPSNHDLGDQELARYTATGGTYYVEVFGVGGASNDQYGYTLNVHN